MKKMYSFFAVLFAFVLNSAAQCPSGQVNVTIDVSTDNWGYECFWDITPSGNGCGNGALFTFGNTAEVNCLSGGTQVATAGGYGNNVTVTETIGCLAITNCFDINYVDDYGDGGAMFEVKFNGVSMQTFLATDSTVNETYSFCVSIPAVYDAKITQSGFKYKMLPLSQSLQFVQPVTILSAGTGTITGVTAQASIFKAGILQYVFTSGPQTLTTLTSSPFAFSQYTAGSFGVHTVKYAADINQVDEVPANDTASFSVAITDTIYAIDDNIALDFIGLGAGEKGYLGNSYEIKKPTRATSISLFLGDGTQNGGTSAVDSVFKVHIFSTDPLGIPQAIIGTTTGTIENVLEKWYTVSFATPVNLPVGKYVVGLEEEHHMHALGFSQVFHPNTSFVNSVTQIPWAPVENFGFPITFMMRLNLETSGLAVPELTNSELEIYPNPASKELSIENTIKGELVQLFNQQGQLVHSSETIDGETVISISELENGLYTIKTVSDNKIAIAKFIKE